MKWGTLQHQSILVFMKANSDNSYTANKVSKYTYIEVEDCKKALDYYSDKGMIKKFGKKYQHIDL